MCREGMRCVCSGGGGELEGGLVEVINTGLLQ